jgi:hypothetical protein
MIDHMKGRTMPATIQLPKAEWFVPVTREERLLSEQDADYAAFHRVSRYVGAWATVLPSDAEDRYWVEVPEFVSIPEFADAPATAEGEAKALRARGKIVTFDFKAERVETRDQCTIYRVTIPDRTYSSF